MKLPAVFFLLIAVVMTVSCGKKGESYIIAELELTENKLLESLDLLPGEIQAVIKEDLADFADSLLPVIEIIRSRDSFLLFPVNKNTYLPENYEPDDLISLDDYSFKVNKSGMKIRKTMLESLQKMIKDAENENLSIMISSAYRSYEYQKNLYDYYTGIYGQEETDRFSARPGTSQHQLGTTVDFGSISKEFAQTPEGLWLLENSWKYGFSLSYPAEHEELTGYNYEPWHFRYIGREAALLENKYFLGIQHYMLEYLEHISLLINSDL